MDKKTLLIVNVASALSLLMNTLPKTSATCLIWSDKDKNKRIYFETDINQLEVRGKFESMELLTLEGLKATYAITVHIEE
jgi:hypothetical protein